jgi:hypothetical protein
MKPNPEQQRLTKAGRAWKHWGPYLAERAWGTVREDYSPNGDAWGYFPHDHARSRVYRWNEDGLAGICDDAQQLCFALALWNGRDPILKERAFGLASGEGNHGEDVKDYYFYLDSTPTHSYMKALYKYPQNAFPYDDLVSTNRGRDRSQPEYELIDTGIFTEDRYFDVFVEYAKASPDDILIRISAFNRGPDAQRLVLLPTLWFRNIWSWGSDGTVASPERPTLTEVSPAATGSPRLIRADHAKLGRYTLACEGADRLLFTENETNLERLDGVPNVTPYVKDAFHTFVVEGRPEAVNPKGTGTKAAALYDEVIPSGETKIIRARLTKTAARRGRATLHPFDDWDSVFQTRQDEADEFYGALQPDSLGGDLRMVQRQAFAGLMWGKQFYHYNVAKWLDGDPSQPPPPEQRKHGRNSEWRHLNASDIISMPDKWEFPWFASWDLALQCIPLALLDPEFAKIQLMLLGHVWYQHPNGQVPGYEYDFGGVNPPVLAWAAWQVYRIDQERGGKADTMFLERVFHKLMLFFSWWVNRKDADGLNVFQGGFLGLDNIGLFDRSRQMLLGGHIEQSDGTSWMGKFCLDMLTIALELATRDRAYEDIALKFFEHFLYIANAMDNIAGEAISLWDDEDEFFYDVLHFDTQGDHPRENMQIRIRSMVGLIPLFAVTTIEPELLTRLPEFRSRLLWFLDHRPDLSCLVSRWHEPGMGERRLLGILRGHRMKRVLRRMLDEEEFLSPHGVRALSRVYADHPYSMTVGGESYTVDYEPAESRSSLFGGNSNWRGPVWMPLNYLIIESLRRFHHYYGDDFVIEHPTGSGNLINMKEISSDLSKRVIGIFARGEDGRRPVFGDRELFQTDPHWKDYLPFHEYFHGDTGAGLGASHQTGWTALVAKLIQEQAEASIA